MKSLDEVIQRPYSQRGPLDATPGDYRARLRVCDKCKLRSLSRCTASNGIVTDMARSLPACPKGFWPGDPPQVQEKPKEKLPEVSPGMTAEELQAHVQETFGLVNVTPRNLIREANPRTIGKIAIACCYFNPEGYKRIYRNFLRFRDEMARYDVDLFVIEAAFDHDSFVVDGATLQVRGTRKLHKLWQKERLLNILIDHIPDEYDAIGWFDCDLIFTNPDWVDAVRETLGKFTLCQPFAGSHYMDEYGGLTKLKHSVGWHLHNDPQNLVRFGQSHPGFAWVARADWLRRHKLPDTMITGGGDIFVAKAITERPLLEEETMNIEWQDSMLLWAASARSDGGRCMGYCPGDVLHMFHGTRENRRYQARWVYLAEHDYNPATDVEIDPENGLVRWSEHALKNKPEMIEKVSGYFAERREDD